MLENESIDKKSVSIDNTIGIFVSLYLLLLAFFIVLTAKSVRVPDKSLVVSQSVSKTFKGQSSIDKAPDAEILSGDLEKGIKSEKPAKPDLVNTSFPPAEKETLARIADILSEILGIEGQFDTKSETLFKAEIPVDLFFDFGSSSIKEDQLQLFKTLAAVAGKPERGYQLDIVILHQNVKEPSENNSERQRSLISRRFITIIDLLENNGMSTGSVAAGYGNVIEDTLLFSFHLSPQFNPSLPLGLE